MKYLITGGCGFLGTNIACHLLSRSDEVVVFDNLSRHGATKNLDWLRGQGKFEFVHGDIRMRTDVEAVIVQHRPDVIFHLAGQVAMTTSLLSPRTDFEVNTAGSLNVLESVRLHAPHTIVVYSSTNKVYGDLMQYSYGETPSRWDCLDCPNGFSEMVPLSFHSPYGCSKGAADQYMLDYHRVFGLRTVVLRHSSMYGGRQFSSYDQGWVGWFCQQALETAAAKGTHSFTVSGDGKQVRDLLHASDAVALYILLADRIGDTAGQVFNIGGGRENSLSILELLTFLSQELNVKLDVRHIAPREGDQRVFVADISHVSQVTGWRPRTSWREGVRQTLDWVKQYA